GGADTCVLPTSSQSRTVDDRLATEFPAASTYPVQLLATGVDAAGLVGRIGALPHVTGASIVAARGSATLINVTYEGAPTGPDARRLVADIRAMSPPADGTIGVTGYTADLVDQLSRLGAKLPWMALF